MSATVAAALKKIAVAILTDKKLRKTFLGIVLGVIIIIVMPFAAIIALFNGGINIDTARLQTLVVQNMSAEEQARLQRVEDLMLEIEDKMLDAGFDQQRVKEAQVLYVLALSDYAEEAGFVDKLVGCFADGQSDAQLISAVNAAFGTNLSAEDFTKVMSAIIIDEDIFEEAAAAKAARQRNQVINECEGIALMRDRIRCGVCGAPMVRHICSKRKVKESWTCANDVCGCRVRISDSDLLMKVTLLMNRIIENADLMVPKPKKRFKDSLTVQRLQGEIDDELAHDQPSEKLIVTRIREIASQLYQETNAKDQIAARIAQKRVTLMSPQAEFNTAYFTDLVENVVLEAPARVTLITKTDVHISEGEPDYGSQENTQEDGDAD